MTTVIDIIELHDSSLVITAADAAIVLSLRPTYVHHWEFQSEGWKGWGLVQDADIRIVGGRMKPSIVESVTSISSGSIRVGSASFDNMLRLPLAAQAEVRATLELTGGTRLDITGSAIEVKLVGPGNFVEDLPVEWAPAEGAA